MNSNRHYGYTPNEQGTGYQINPGEAQEVQRLFEQAATKGVAIYMRTNDPEKEAAPKRAALYTRSATSQEPGEENNALATQMRLCRMYCQSHGYTVDDKHIYSEIGSGNDGYTRRPQLAALLDAAKQREFDVLVIATHNRLSRRLAHAAAIIEELQQHGVQVENVDGQNLDDFTPLVQALREQVSQTEQQKIVSRMQLGKAAKRAQREQQQ